MTHRQSPARRIFGALGTPLLMAGLLIGLGSAAASASGCQSWTRRAATKPWHIL